MKQQQNVLGFISLMLKKTWQQKWLKLTCSYPYIPVAVLQVFPKTIKP